MSPASPTLTRAVDILGTPALATVAMVALAALDLLGAYAAKELHLTDKVGWAVLGVGSFGVLFFVYSASLAYAELAVVTMGWIVLLQVGLVVLDRVKFGVSLPPDALVALGIILAAQGYLVFRTSGTGSA